MFASYFHTKKKTKTKVEFKFVNSIGIRVLKFYSYCNRHYCKVLVFKFPCYFFHNIHLQMIKHRIIGEFGDKGLLAFGLI